MSFITRSGVVSVIDGNRVVINGRQRLLRLVTARESTRGNAISFPAFGRLGPWALASNASVAKHGVDGRRRAARGATESEISRVRVRGG